VADAPRQELAGQRLRVPVGSAAAKAIYSLKRWHALTRYIDDGDLPADNNWVERQIRPIAIGRSNSHDRLPIKDASMFCVALQRLKGTKRWQ